MSEVYISCDVETDGPIPGPNSMLSLGAAAFYKNDEGVFQLLDTFSANFQVLPDAAGDPGTMQWWNTQQEAWEAHRKDLVSPEKGMGKFVGWVHTCASRTNSRPVFVGYPAGFDFLFIYWYLIKFCGQSPFSFSAIDMKTYAMALLKKPYRDVSKKTMPKSWFPPQKHTHIAVDDAIEQGWIFVNMLKDNR